ncbi:MAG: hypothetical protein DRH32_07130 [Deltaproteobacteria bacterium]|nr:MAG: hypothetical protein DRH32_07130 [Deltaproteobacteria bacterium]
MMIRKIFFEVLLIAFAAVLLALTVNRLRPDGLPLFPAKNSDSHPEQTAPGEISITEAIKHFHAGTALFVDARPASDFNTGHIHGAINLTTGNMDKWIDGFLADTSPDTLIIAYCDGLHCSLGRDLAEQFRLLGYTEAYYLKNGWSQWKKQGMPADSIN